MDDLINVPFDLRTRDMVRKTYHQLYPILRAYEDVVRQHSDPACSINDPSTGGVDTVRAAGEALRMIGKPPRDLQDREMALQHIRALQDEMESQSPPEDPDLASAVIAAEYPWAGCVMDAESFEEMSPERQQEHVEMIVSDLSEDDLRCHLIEALQIALPTIYRRITSDDERRRKASVPIEGDLS